MLFRRIGLGLLALISGILLSLAFPPWGWDELVWLWAMPLLVALWSGAGKWRRLGPLLLGGLAGMAAYLPSLSWVRHSSRVINGARGEEWMGWGIELMGWGAAVGLAFYCAAFVAGWALFVSTVGRPRWALLLKPGVSLLRGSAEALRVSGLAALAWVALEWVRGWLFTGFGWNGLGVALHENKVMIQAADLVGVAGLSFLPMLICVTVLLTVWRVVVGLREGRGLRRQLDLAVAVSLLGAQLVYGVGRYGRPAPVGTELKLALVQQNVDQVDRWTLDEAVVQDIYQRYANMTELYAGKREGGDSAVDLVVWPESGMLLTWYHPSHEAYLNGLLGTGDYALLTGVDVDEPTVGLYNSAALVRGNIDNVKFHHKLHLVPFGEYLPGRSWVPGLEAVLGGILPMDLGAGTSTEPLKLEKPAVEIIPLICFEDTVGRVARRFAREGPQVMINMTNDGWFIRSVENQVHLNNALFRCVELRRPMCRAANTGVTAVIDDRGVVVDELRDPQTGSPFIQGVLPAKVVLPDKMELTVYARFGDWFAALALWLCVAVWLWRRVFPLHEEESQPSLSA
jgi:apolipoprotein N-acyltransferase